MIGRINFKRLNLEFLVEASSMDVCMQLEHGEMRGIQLILITLAMRS